MYTFKDVEHLDLLLTAKFQLTKDGKLKFPLVRTSSICSFEPSLGGTVSVNEGCFSKDCLERTSTI